MYSQSINQFFELNGDDLFAINGGKLETVSDWLLLGGAVCACFVSPYIGVPLAIAVAVWS